MPKKGAASAGGKIGGGGKGSTEQDWDVSAAAHSEAQSINRKQEPFQQGALNAGAGSFPAIYGADLKERQRQNILSAVAGGGARDHALAQQLGPRQVMLDKETTEWLLKEQDRLKLIQIDQAFEKSAKAQHLFESPHGLQYLQKIRPDWFKRRKKLAKWVARAQLKLFDLEMNGVQSPQDFEFMIMLQGLGPKEFKLLQKPVWKLLEDDFSSDEGYYQPGIFRQTRATSDNTVIPFAGVGSAGLQGTANLTGFSGTHLRGGVASPAAGAGFPQLQSVMGGARVLP